MRHIETGNTKLSPPVFVDIADALSVRTDELLYDVSRVDKNTLKQEITAILDSCSAHDMYILTDIIRAVKVSLDKYSE